MLRAVWATPLLLLGILVANAAANLTPRYNEDSGRIQILSNVDDREVELGYITVHSELNSYSPRYVSVAGEESFYFGETKIAFRREDRAGRCLGVYQWVDTPKTVLTNCQNHLASHIYGGMESTYQNWPIEDNKYDHYAYVTNRRDHAGIAARYWLFSDGRFVRVHSNVPLFIDQNTDQSPNALCFIAENTAPYPEDRSDNLLQWELCSFENAREAHEHAVQNYLGKPSSIPDERMVTHPIWTTVTSDDGVRQAVNEIIANGFNYSHVEIGDKWETCYGSLTFDTTKFPDIRSLTDDLHALGFRISLWMHPFMNRHCEPYYWEALNNGYFVSDTNGSTITRWWRGHGGIVDVTNTEAATWWTNHLWALRNESGVDSFHFDAGQSSYLPQQADIEPRELDPVLYTSQYAETASQFGPMVVLRASVDSQQLPHFFVMDIVDSSWSKQNGLQSLIPKLLQMSVSGHPFVMPELVGGSRNKGVTPTSDLFIRWLQATVFMPALRFSTGSAPWTFDNETLEIARNLTDLHAQYAPRIVELMNKAVEDGTPVNLPIWWIDPTDSAAQTMDSEFLLGEDVLVAPVVWHNTVSRDIYLPKGSWRDEADPAHPVIKGPAWLHDYSAPLNTLPYFTRVSASQLSKTE